MTVSGDLKAAYEAITGKQKDFTDAWNYYLGDHPLVYANDRLKEIFSTGYVRFTENWCSVVIDALKDRLELGSFDVVDALAEAVQKIWDDNQIGLESDDLHEAALVCGEAFLVIWPDESGKPEMYYNDPRLCHAFYYPERPRAMRFAAKMWTGEDKHLYMTLYYSDRLEYFRSASKAENVSKAENFQPMEEPDAPNPYGVIPVFHFRNRRQVVGELVDVIPVQNGINKLLTDMMVAAEYGAFQQRWIISNADVGGLKNSPNEIWAIPTGDGISQGTSVGAFEATDLKNYLDAINQLAGDVARITRLPRHYFYAQGGDPSGEALIAMEAPLNKKAEKKVERWSVTWQQAMAFALRLADVQIEPSEIMPVFKPVSTVQPKTEAEIRVLNIQAGLPLTTTLRREGWTDEEIEQMEADKEASSEGLGEALLGAFDRGSEDLE